MFAWHDALGTAGVFFIVLAYWLVQSERLASSDKRWSWLNLVGSALVLTSLTMEFNLSAFLVEAFWLLISLYGLFRRPRAA